MRNNNLIPPNFLIDNPFHKTHIQVPIDRHPIINNRKGQMLDAQLLAEGRLVHNAQLGGLVVLDEGHQGVYLVVGFEGLQVLG